MNPRPNRPAATDNTQPFPRRRRFFSNRSIHKLTGAVALALATVLLAGCPKKKATVIRDEPKLAGKTTADFPQITADVFKPMDGGIELDPEGIMGRNAWNLWSGGTEIFWNHVSQDSYGLL